jgi:hypothetical protein
MNAESETTKPKSKIISIPFLLVAVVLVVGGYPAGKWAMEKFMTMQEQGKAAADPIPPDPDLKRTGIGAMAEQQNSMGGAGGPRGAGGGGGGGGGGFDPEAAFTRWDADSNGKLEGEEISERMKDRVEAMDTDKDGAISKEEFMASRQNRGGGEDGQRQRRPDDDDSDGNADNATSEKGDQ